MGEGDKITSFGLRLKRGETEISVESFGIDISGYGLKGNTIFCSSNANLLLLFGDDSTTAVSWDMGKSAQDGVFLIRKFPNYVFPDFETIALSEKSYQYRLTDADKKLWVLDFAQAYLHLQLENGSSFGKTFTVDDAVVEKTSSTTQKGWKQEFDLKGNVQSEEETTLELF